MKSLTKIFLFIPLCFLLLSNSCKKTGINSLPPATQTGANTFGCLVNGKAWIPTGGGVGSGINPTSGGFYVTPDGKINIYIKAYSYNDYIDIYLKQITHPGTYYLNKNTGVSPNFVYPESYGAYFINSASDYFVTDTAHTGIVRITYADTINTIASGTFEMKLYRKNTNEVINITDGRFDYRTH